jgi:hypothetical protein
VSTGSIALNDDQAARAGLITLARLLGRQAARDAFEAAAKEVPTGDAMQTTAAKERLQ